MPLGLSVKRLNINPELRERVANLSLLNRKGFLKLPDYLGKPGMVLISDSHGETESYLTLYEALPAAVRFGIDLGDKVDRGPNPLAMNYLLQTLRVKRTLGNHDAMWLAAGLGIKPLAIELVRWLMRYNEIDFLATDIGVNLQPLRIYAEKHFRDGTYRIDTRSKVSRKLEAAATYLKIIAEARMRFPEHRDTVLNESDLRIRKALFLESAAEALTPSEKNRFNHLISGEKLDKEQGEYFYRLMGGLKTLDAEEQKIVDHFADEFRDNYSFYQFTRWMVAEGDMYLTFHRRQGYPCTVLATHALISVDENGELKEHDGETGREALINTKERIQISLEAWRQYLEHDDITLFELHANDIERLGKLAWHIHSPLYGRQMQTAARAVLPQSSGLWDEPEEPFFTHFEANEEPEMVTRTRANIARSFGFNNPDNYVIVRGHKPTKDGLFQLLAGGTVINIDGGMAEKYGGKGGAIIFGSNGAAWLSYPSLEFTRVPLPVTS